MARGSTSKGGQSKVRLVILEAEIAEGDFSQITQAVQNALRPQIISAARPLSTSSRVIEDGSSQAEQDDDLAPDEAEEEPIKSAGRSARPRKPRVLKTPEVVDDIDFVSEPNLKDYVSRFDLKHTLDKFLVIALWFRDERSTPTISDGHIYTCFKRLSWSTNAPDFAKPLRNLRDEQYFKGGSKEGWTLSITGAGKIEDKKSG